MAKLSKRELRDKMRALNSSLGCSDRAARSQVMQERLLDSTLWNEAEIVALYMPLTDEPDTRLLFAEAVSSGKLSIFPRCAAGPDKALGQLVPQADERTEDQADELAVERAGAAGRMELASCTCLGSFTAGRFGVMEPDNTCQVMWPGIEPFLPELKKTLIIVPGRAFDRHGGRLGRGGGYYDRWLSLPGLRGAFFLGYGFSSSVVSDVPCEKHDIRLHGLCTDQELIAFQGRTTCKK